MMERQRNEPLLKKGKKKKVTETGVSGVFFLLLLLFLRFAFTPLMTMA